MLIFLWLATTSFSGRVLFGKKRRGWKEEERVVLAVEHSDTHNCKE